MTAFFSEIDSRKSEHDNRHQSSCAMKRATSTHGHASTTVDVLVLCQRCGQQVFHQKPRHTFRLGPVTSEVSCVASCVHRRHTDRTPQSSPHRTTTSTQHGARSHEVVEKRRYAVFRSTRSHAMHLRVLHETRQHKTSRCMLFENPTSYLPQSTARMGISVREPASR